MSETKQPSKLSQMRMGVPIHDEVMIRDVKFAVVILPSDTVRQIEEDVERYMESNKGKVNERVHNLMFDSELVYYSLRDIDDSTLKTKVADSAEEVRNTFDEEDISRVTEVYGTLMMNKSKKLELLNEEQFDEIKKVLEVTPLSELSTVSQVHLANFHQATILKA